MTRMGTIGVPGTSCEVAAQAFNTYCVCRKASLEEELCCPVSSLIGGARRS